MVPDCSSQKGKIKSSNGLCIILMTHSLYYELLILRNKPQVPRTSN